MYFFGDFDDDFDEDEFMKDDLFEDSFEEMEDPFAGNNEMDDEPSEAETLDDELKARDAFFLGSTLGFAYEEGLRQGKRKKRKKLRDDSD